MSSPDYAAELEFATYAARRAGELTLQHFQSPGLSVRTKADGSPVSIADQEAERFLRERLDEAFPNDGILGEEEGETEGTSGRRWLLDPIDGTMSFVHGVPLYGTLLALEVGDDVVVGVASMPAIRETVAAARGGGGALWYRGDAEPVPARVSKVARLSDAVISTTSQQGLRIGGREEAYERLIRASKDERGWGDLFGHVLVATGRLDVMVDPLMNIWDNAALRPIVEEAGGSFTDLAGKRTHTSPHALSTNGRVLDEVLATLG